MKLTQKNLLYLAAFVVVGYLIYKQFRGKDDQPDVDNSKTTGGVVSKVVANVNASVWGTYKSSMAESDTVKKGDYSAAVKTLQQAINAKHASKGISSIAVDGKFGAATESALYALTGKKSGTLRDLIYYINQ